MRSAKLIISLIAVLLLAAWGRGGIPNPVLVPQVIGAVNLSNLGFSGGAATGTAIGSIAIGMTPASPAFSGSLAVVSTGTDNSGAACTSTNSTNFQIVGAILEVKLNGLAAGTYPGVCISATQSGISNSPYIQAFMITGSSGGMVLALQPVVQNPTASSTPNPGFLIFGYPFKDGDVPSGSIVTATLGGTSIPVQGYACTKHADGSLATCLMVADISGAPISAGSSATMVFTSVAGSWSTTTSRTTLDWQGLVDTYQITSLSTTSTSAPDMNGAGTWVATNDNTATVTTIGTGPLGRVDKVTANFVNTVTHRFLRAWTYYFVAEKADTSLGPIAHLGPFIDNTRVLLSNPGSFTYNLSWLRNGVTQRSSTGVQHAAMTFSVMPRLDGQWDWSADDPGTFIQEPYAQLGATLKLPRFQDGIVYSPSINNAGSIPSTSIAGINTSSGVFMVSSVSPLFGQQHHPTAIDFTAASLPTGLSSGIAYWAHYLSPTTFSVYDNQVDAIAGTSTGQIIPSTAGSTVAVELSAAPMTPGLFQQYTFAAGSRPDLGLLSEWSSVAVVYPQQAQQRLARVMAYATAGNPMFFTDATTNRIPSFLDASGTPAGMTSMPTTYWLPYDGAAGQYSFTKPTGGENFWQDDTAHQANTLYAEWVLSGNPFLRDLLIYWGNRAIGNVTLTSQRNFSLLGTTYYGSVFYNNSGEISRAGAWAERDVAEAAEAAYDGSLEQTYFHNVLNNNGAQGAAYVAYKGSNYGALGALHENDLGHPPATVSLSVVEGFEQNYMVIGTAWGAVLQGDYVSGLNTMADTNAKWPVGLQALPCNYFSVPYGAGPALSDFGVASPGSYPAAFTDVGIGGAAVTFSYVNGGQDITWAGGNPVWTLAVGDVFRPQNYNNLQTTLSPLPSAASPLVDGTDYYIVSVNTGAKTFQVSATPNGAAITFGATVNGSGGWLVPAAQTGELCPATGTVAGPVSGGDTYIAYQAAGLSAQAWRNATGASSAWASLATRMIGNFNSYVEWGFQPNL